MRPPLTPRRLDRALNPPMVWLAYAFLLLVAAILPQAEGNPDNGGDLLSGLVIIGVAAVICILWTALLLECAARLIYLDAGRRSWRRVGHLLLVALIPPMRVGLTPTTAHHHIWLPVLGWRARTKPLRKELSRHFSVPMILFALMILPVLAVEYFWHEQLQAYLWLAVAVDAATKLIWLAFAVEFFTRLAADDEKLSYCVEHWIDALIVAFPIVSFLRIMRVLRVAKLMKAGRLAKMSRLYRLRGLAMRGYRALLVLRLLERTSTWGAKTRLSAMRRSLEAKHEEIAELEEDIAELAEIVAEQQREKKREKEEKERKKQAAEAQQEAGAASGKI